jgi:H+-translocating diphosphatase
MSGVPTEIALDSTFAYTFIFSSCFVGLIFGVWNWWSVMSIKIEGGDREIDTESPLITNENNKLMIEISEKIQNGATTFLMAEYLFLGVFLIIFSVFILISDEFKYFYTTAAFILGALTSLVSGYIGMYIATRANVRVAFMAAVGKSNEESLKNAFNVAFKGGCVMGFCLVSLALSILALIIMIFSAIFVPEATTYTKLFEFIAGYGLGGSTVALFCRVGGGIYTKAADVGADLVGKNELGLDEDSPENPATIADNVGDNVGDIAGMGSDLFGSFAESTCAALVISGSSPNLCVGANFMFPLMISAVGILASIITAFFATHIMTVTEQSKIERTLKWQLIISTIILTPAIVLISILLLPAEITFNKLNDKQVLVKSIDSSNIMVMICALCGLWSGLLIGYFTDYFTSNAHQPTIDLAHSCKSGAAINIIHGLALGYLSCIVPILAIAATLYTSFKVAGMYGIAISALGMLSNLSISLAIDAYGPISDNAGGISEMSLLPKSVRVKTDALDAAGNTTAAIGKGFAIGSACLVSLALFGAFVTRTQMDSVDILNPLIISTLIIGAMIPYAFSALTMKSVGQAAAQMCEQVKKQVRENNTDPTECIAISTKASLKEMIIPGVMVIVTPLILGVFFGPKAIAGYLAGVIVSGVQMAISSSNSGGAWDNAKKYIEAKNLIITDTDRKGKDKKIKEEDVAFPKGSKPHKAAVVGDTVGDPLKDTSGPSLNILIKLSAIVSLVFGSFFAKHAIFPNA